MDRGCAAGSKTASADDFFSILESTGSATDAIADHLGARTSLFAVAAVLFAEMLIRFRLKLPTAARTAAFLAFGIALDAAFVLSAPSETFHAHAATLGHAPCVSAGLFFLDWR